MRVCGRGCECECENVFEIHSKLLKFLEDEDEKHKRAPPEAYSIKRVIFSPTADPLAGDPVIKKYNINQSHRTRKSAEVICHMKEEKTMRHHKLGWSWT